jgi:hypothetical protein
MSASTGTAADQGPMPYREERALERTAIIDGLVPTRLLAVLFPVWVVEVESKVTEGEPYAVIDRYVERAIAEGRISTEKGLADFLCLDLSVVSRAVRFLRSIGHVVDGGGGGELVVTELGFRSLREEVRYTVTVNDRRKLYFDGFTSRPLTRPYYESAKVTLLGADEARSLQARRRGPRFHPLYSLTGLDPQAVTRLAADSGRDRFNLPERIENPRAISPAEVLHLPLYVVRAVTRDGRVRYLPFSQASEDEQADTDLEPMVQASQAPGLLETEVESGRTGQDEKLAREWLRNRDLDRWQPTPTDHGTWEVHLPPGCFGADADLPLSRVGSYVMLGTGFLRIRCDSDEVRRRALVGRMDAYLGYRSRPDRADVEAMVDRIAHQLDLGAVSLTTLARWVESDGNRTLATQLSRLASTPTNEA